MNKKYIILLLIVIAAFIGAYSFYLNDLDNTIPDVSVTPPGTNDVLQEYLNEELRDGVLEHIGQPIEGFIPFMFMEAFSGILPQDFDGADALLGEYTIIEKKLTFIVDKGNVIHSAADALSDEGMKTVFINLQIRRNITITTTDEIDSLLLFLEASTDTVVTTDCLPEQRNVGACIEIYQPVCAAVRVECITTPCDPVKETYSNSCKACSNERVSTYTEGECKAS